MTNVFHSNANFKQNVTVDDVLTVNRHSEFNSTINVDGKATINNQTVITRNSTDGTDDRSVSILAPNINSGQSTNLLIGKSDSSNKCAIIGYREPGTCTLSLNNSSDVITYDQSNVNINRKLNLNNSIRTTNDLISVSDTVGVKRGVYVRNNNDAAAFRFSSTASDSGYLEICTGDNGNEPIYVRQYGGSVTSDQDTSTWFNSLQRTLTLLDSSGNTYIPGNLYIGSSSMNVISELNNLKALL